jgi:2-oxoisovalerate dehydrogenase E1 component beta subunit
MSNLCSIEAINQALAYALAEDPSVVVLGEDIGVNGGVFRATDGLLARFGAERVLDTPLAETLIAGMAVGMAAEGFRPVAEIQFSGFIYSAIDQIVNHASRLRRRSNGRLQCPLVIRAPNGGGIHAPEHHSESVESFFTQVPGLRVVVPSSPSRAYGLLLSAIRDPDPVIFLEPPRLYRAGREEVIDNGDGLPLDVCYVLMPGSDVTLIGWGAMTQENLLAAKHLATLGVSAEVIDVATLKPLDMTTICTSVAKTGHAIIVYEAPRACGVGAEIAAQLADEGLLSLQAPVARVTGFDTIMPLFRLEQTYLPNAERIVHAVRDNLAFA